MLENRLASTEDNAEKTQIETIKKANEILLHYKWSC
jgi:hypothetical protein